jgi:iron-sulfur cluster assembly accessory protein
LTVEFNSDNIALNYKGVHNMATSEQVAAQVITITPSAAQAVQAVIAEKNLEGYALRIYASGGGCGGVQFGMALDNDIQEKDFSFEIDGIQLVVDNLSMEYLQDATIDFVNHPQHGPGFVVNQPHGQQSEDGCACGGSCACSN